MAKISVNCYCFKCVYSIWSAYFEVAKVSLKEKERTFKPVEPISPAEARRRAENKVIKKAAGLATGTVDGTALAIVKDCSRKISFRAIFLKKD